MTSGFSWKESLAINVLYAIVEASHEHEAPVTDPKLVNLNRVRKDRDRAERKARADANAVLHGLSKAERLLRASQAETARKRLDAHRFEDEE